MSFLDEVDSLKARAGFSTPNIFVIIGLGSLSLAVLCFIGFQIWMFVSAPDLTVQHDGETIQNVQVDEQSTSSASIFVHVAGEVNSPGLYELSSGARLSEAIEAAGGFTENAVASSVNLARILNDGEQIFVNSTLDRAVEQGNGNSSGVSNAQGAPSKVNLNTASADELMSLDGIGQATADKIIAYREEQGPFASIDQIKEVSGIGDKKFEGIKDFITV